MALKRYAGILSLASVVVTVQLLTAWTGKSYYLTQLTMSAYYCLVVTSLCLLMGYAGQISLGHAGFFAIGGYLSALLTTYDLSSHRDATLFGFLESAGAIVDRQDLYGLQVVHLNPWAAFAVAVLAAVGIAWIIAGPVLRLKGHYLAMATLGFGIIVYHVVLGTAVFGEADGLSDVPPFTFLPGVEVSGSRAARVTNYYLAWGLVVAGMWTLLNLVDSRVGRALKAIHGSEEAAEAVGVDTSGFKLRIFVLSAAFTAVAGALLTHYNGGIGPSEASVMKSVRYVAIVAVGGMANLWGALVMGAILNFLSLRGYFGSFDDAVFGAILIFIMLFAPEGIVGAGFLRRLKRLLGREGEVHRDAAP